MSDPVEVFLQDFHGFALLVLAPTGVTYRHQCGGAMCDQRGAEGYLVPCDPYIEGASGQWVRGQDLADRLTGGIERGAERSDFALLKRLVAELRVLGPKRRWHESEWGALALDEDRRAEALEAWVPVLSPYGVGYLIWENSD